MSGVPDWIEIMDEKRGRTYFHDKSTGTTTWTRPEGVPIRKVEKKKTGPLPTGWKEIFDSNHNRPYFVNMSTGRSTWVRPQPELDASDVASGPSQGIAPAASGATGTVTQAPVATAPIPAPLAVSSTPVSIEKSLEEPVRPTPIIESRPESNEPKKPSLIAALPPEIAADIHKFKMRDFAKAHFQQRKKGLFRRLIPPEEMLRFANTPISKPLLRLSSQTTKLACVCFKLILGYMGERSGTRGDSLFLAKSLVQHGLENPELRDEIFVQLVKQTSSNGNIASLMRGWELMLLMCSSYPPSNDLESYLINHIVRNLSEEKNTDVVAYAKLSLSRLKRIISVGPRGKLWTAEEIDSLKDLPFQPLVFGVTLEDVMERQKERGVTLDVPEVLHILTDVVIKSDGTATEGVFRLPGDMDEVARFRVEFDKGNYSLPEFTMPHIPASLLKLWMRELAEPIIPATLYDDCLGASSNETESLTILSKLPELNARVLKYIVKFLQKFAAPEIESVTKMGVDNLAMVFCPNLLRCPSQDPNVILDCSRKEQAFLRHLIGKLQ